MEEKLNKEEEATLVAELTKSHGWRRWFWPWVQAERAAVVEAVAKLALDDAPKAKYSALSGELRFIEKICEEIEAAKKP